MIKNLIYNQFSNYDKTIILFILNIFIPFNLSKINPNTIVTINSPEQIFILEKIIKKKYT